MVKEKQNKKEKVEKKVAKAINKKYRSEEQETMVRFAIILGIIIVFIVGIYFFTKIVVKKDANSTENITAGEINYDKVIIGNMLNRSAKNYYVFIYSGNGNKAINYSALIDTYSKKENAKEAYWADLDNALNEKHKATTEKDINISTKDVKELKFGEFALVKVKDNKISKIFTTIEDAKNELGI